MTVLLLSMFMIKLCCHFGQYWADQIVRLNLSKNFTWMQYWFDHIRISWCGEWFLMSLLFTYSNRSSITFWISHCTFYQRFQSFINSFNSLNLFVFFLYLNIFLLIFKLSLSQGVLFLKVLSFCYKKLFDTLIFELVELVFILFEFSVELKFLEFGFFNLISQLFNLWALSSELFFNIFLFSDFFSVVFEFSLQSIDFWYKLSFLIIGECLIFLF